MPSDGGGLLAVDFDADALDPDNLPPALLRRLPGLDLAALRQGVAAAARAQGWAARGRMAGLARRRHGRRALTPRQPGDRRRGN